MLTSCVGDFKITKISQMIIANSYFTYIAELRNQLQSSEMHEPLEVRNFVSCKNRQSFFNLIRDIQKKDFRVAEDCDIYHYKLSSHGPNPAVHFMWKQPKDDEMSEQQQSVLANNVRKNSNYFITVRVEG